MSDTYFEKQSNLDVLYAPEERICGGRNPYRWGHATNMIGFDPHKEQRRRHAIGWLQIAATIIAIVALILLYNAIVSSAHAEGEISFPSYWKYDSNLVKAVQERLNHYGADLAVDGDFGPATGQAVKDFQKKKGMDITGVVDDDVAKKLKVENWPKGTTMYYMADLEAAYDKCPNEWLLYISLGGRARTSHFALFKDGIMVAECACITGNEAKGHFTPLGVHTISKKSKTRDGDGYSYYDQLWLKVKGEDSNYAIHSLLDYGDGDIGNQVLGSHVANGCIRVPFELSRWLRLNVPKNTVVVIDDRNFQPSSIGFEDLVDDD